MGTIAARDAERVCTLTERVVAIHLLAAAQACDIKKQYQCKAASGQSCCKKSDQISAPLIEDRPMDKDIENMCTAIRYSDFFRIKP